MDYESLTNFVVLMNRRFRRIKFPFGKGMMLRLYNAAGCCLSHFKWYGDRKGFLPGYAVLGTPCRRSEFMKPVRLTNRSPGSPALVGGEFLLTTIQSGRYYDAKFIAQA